MNRYERLKILGQGGFGKVYLMRDKEKQGKGEDDLVAVKFIKLNDFTQKADGIFEIDRESKTLRMLNSRYIV